MNTLLGEVATLSDVQYLHYRVAFKLRKLQKSFLLDCLEVPGLQEVLHSAGMQGMGPKDHVTASQLRGLLTELYSLMRMARPALTSTQLKEAENHCFSWLMMAFQCKEGQKIEAGVLKIALCLFTGSKPSEKAKYIFSVLINKNGAVGQSGIKFFCYSTQKLATCLQENLYSRFKSQESIFLQCMVFVRSAEDVEEEVDDGGFKRPWLSCFEFTRVFSETPEPSFLDWFCLWNKLPAQEKVIHPMRCAICTRKPIVCFRYQCTKCPNFQMCQMCFLKGRTTEKHSLSHKVLEFQSNQRGGGWHKRFSSKGGQEGGRLMDSHRSPFTHTPSIMVGHASSSHSSLEDSCDTHGSTKPTVIRIGSGDSNRKARDSGKPPSSRTTSNTAASSCSSPDSSSLCSSHYSIDGSCDSHSRTSSLPPEWINAPQWEEPSKGTRKVLGVHVRGSEGKAVDANKERETRDLVEVNRRLSREVDQLVSELSVPSSPVPMEQLKQEEQTLRSQVHHLSDRRSVLAQELQDLMTHVQQMQVGLSSLGQGGPPYSSVPKPPMHVRTGSAPIHTIGTGANHRVIPYHSRECSDPSPFNNHRAPPMVAPRAQQPTPTSKKFINGPPTTTAPHDFNGIELRRVYTPPLVPPEVSNLDPLMEYTPSDQPSNYRLSMAW